MQRFSPSTRNPIPLAVLVADIAMLAFGTGAQVTLGGLADLAAGLTFLASSLGMALASAAYAWAQLSHDNYQDGLPGTVFAAWLNGWIAIPSLVGLVTLVPLLFPDGRLPSPRWRWVAVLAGAGITGTTIGSALAPGPMQPIDIDNPIGLQLGHPLVDVVGAVDAIAGIVVFGLALVALVTRYRHGSSVERLQLRWFAFPATIAIVLFGLSAVFTTGLVGDIAWIGGLAALAALPIAIGVAILRYHLYDIDLILNRAAVYATVSVLLVALFVVGNVVLQYALESITRQRSELLSGALGVGVGLLFVPMRRRIRPLIDRILPGRAVLALLFNDIVGSTETIVDIGDQRWRALLGQYLGAVRAELGRFNGHEVNTAGDAFFATFSRPMDALHAAWAIRASVNGLGLETRTGLHLGEVELRGEQISGLAVHTAARVMAAAGSSEILVSDAMRGALSVGNVALHDRGRHALKGVPGDWQLYAVEQAG